MIIIGIIGKIGSGKTYIANKITKFNFNADKEVRKIYKNAKENISILLDKLIVITKQDTKKKNKKLEMLVL